MNAVYSHSSCWRPPWAASFFCSPGGKTPAAASTAPAACPSSAPTCRWTTASTGWTSTARTTCSPTSAAGRTTAAFLLHLTLHQPTQQPLDTLYTLRLDPGRQTIVTLIFIREAFGYKEPLFPQEMLDEVYGRRSWTPTGPVDFCGQRGFSFARSFLLYLLMCARQTGALGASSSVGQSWRLITAWSRVQVLAGPYKKDTCSGVFFALEQKNRIFFAKNTCKEGILVVK